jgi:soluble lytic murein transglycosylase-like protein
MGLTLGAIALSPSGYRGKTVEIDGRLVGVCSAEDGLTRLMLQTDSPGTLSLTMSRLPDWIRSGDRLRVLVIVTAAGGEDTVEIGVPEMEVLAVASAWDLKAMEERERSSKAARLAYDKAVRAAQQRVGKRSSGGTLASRSGARSAMTSRNTPVPTGGLSDTAQSVFPAYRAFIKSRNPRLTESQASDITWAVLRYSEALDTDPRLVIALIIAESDFNPNSTSRTGAMGLGQLMPGTAQDIAAKTGLSNPYDPVQNIAGSIWLLRSHLDKYSGGKSMTDLKWNHISLALAAYNAGAGAVKKYKGIPPYRETQNYVRKINSIYRQLCGETG